MYNKDYLLSLRGKERRDMYKKLAPLANKQRDRIIKAGYKKESVLNVLGKRDEWNPDKYNQRAYMKLVRFVTARSHTLTGIKEIRQERTQALRNLGISEELLNDQDFYAFLHSQEYKSLKCAIHQKTLLKYMICYTKRVNQRTK